MKSYFIHIYKLEDYFSVSMYVYNYYRKSYWIEVKSIADFLMIVFSILIARGGGGGCCAKMDPYLPRTHKCIIFEIEVQNA